MTTETTFLITPYRADAPIDDGLEMQCTLRPNVAHEGGFVRLRLGDARVSDVSALFGPNGAVISLELDQTLPVRLTLSDFSLGAGMSLATYLWEAACFSELQAAIFVPRETRLRLTAPVTLSLILGLKPAKLWWWRAGIHLKT